MRSALGLLVETMLWKTRSNSFRLFNSAPESLAKPLPWRFRACLHMYDVTLYFQAALLCRLDGIIDDSRPHKCSIRRFDEVKKDANGNYVKSISQLRNKLKGKFKSNKTGLKDHISQET